MVVGGWAVVSGGWVVGWVVVGRVFPAVPTVSATSPSPITYMVHARTGPGQLARPPRSSLRDAAPASLSAGELVAAMNVRDGWVQVCGPNVSSALQCAAIASQRPMACAAERALIKRTRSGGCPAVAPAEVPDRGAEGAAKEFARVGAATPAGGQARRQ